MPDAPSSAQRTDLLADVAEMYFLQKKTQAQIARYVGVTRSMVSRMLTEARRLGIVEINVHRAFSYDRQLQSLLVERFGLISARVFSSRPNDPHLLARLGSAGASALKEYLQPGITLGLPWGTTVSAVVDALKVEAPIPIKVVQLIGALGSRNLKFDGHGVVQRLAEKLGAESFYINAPFLVESPETVQSLLLNKSISEALYLASRCNVALLGVGSTLTEHSTYYHAGYLQLSELEKLQEDNAVGGVCRTHFDLQGKPVGLEFERRTIGIHHEILKTIPIRLGVAGGLGKATAILGALRGKFINVLVTDSAAAGELLRLSEVARRAGAVY